MERVGDEKLAHLGAVRVGRVDQVDAELDRTAENAACVLPVVRPPEDLRPCDAHGTEPETVDFEVAADRECVGPNGHEPLTLAAATLPGVPTGQAQSSRATAA